LSMIFWTSFHFCEIPIQLWPERQFQASKLEDIALLVPLWNHVIFPGDCPYPVPANSNRSWAPEPGPHQYPVVSWL
jgi:hypothetical protein